MRAIAQFITANGIEEVFNEGGTEQELRQWLFDLSLGNQPFLGGLINDRGEEHKQTLMVYSRVDEKCMAVLRKYVEDNGGYLDA